MKLADLIQMPEETDASVRFLPGYAFFCRTLELPEELGGGADLYSFAELSLESLSPFPLEQLAWGYLVDKPAGQLFLYAACRPRLPAEALEDWELPLHTFPRFLPVLLASPSEATVRVFQSDVACTLLVYEGGGRFPAQIISAPLPEEATDEDRMALRQRLSARLRGPAATLKQESLRLLRCSREGDGLCFVLENTETGEQRLVYLEGEETLWAADVREPDFITAERRRRVATGRVGTALKAAGIAVTVLILMMLLTWVGDWLVSRRKDLVERQADAAFTVQQNMDFLNELEQFSEEPFRPFTELAAANQVLLEREPRRIEFTSASLSSNNELSIQGESTNVEEVNLYSDRLRESGYFSEVILADVRTRGGKVNFSLNLRFNPESLSGLLAEPEPEAVAATEGEPAESTETPEETPSDPDQTESQPDLDPEPIP